MIILNVAEAEAIVKRDSFGLLSFLQPLFPPRFLTPFSLAARHSTLFLFRLFFYLDLVPFPTLPGMTAQGSCAKLAGWRRREGEGAGGVVSEEEKWIGKDEW